MMGLGRRVLLMSRNYLATFGFDYTDISCSTGCGLDGLGIESR
jgi:hypothetical protein